MGDALTTSLVSEEKTNKELMISLTKKYTDAFIYLFIIIYLCRYYIVCTYIDSTDPDIRA